MVKAVWDGEVIAESDDTIVVEGNHYFPPAAIQTRFLVPSSHTSFCPWKGTAKYFSVKTDGGLNENAVWIYPETKPEADHIRGYYAFWKGVEVS